MTIREFPFRFFFILLFILCSVTFYAANTLSVSRYSTQEEMITPFPVALQLPDNTQQVVTHAQLGKLQLPDPETGQRLIPLFLLDPSHFSKGTMATKTIIGTSITNGQTILIPTNYSAKIEAKQIDPNSQQITLTYTTGADEDQLITAIYTASRDQYTPTLQYVKNILVWKSIFMNGMMISLIAAFIITRKFGAKKKTTCQNP